MRPPVTVDNLCRQRKPDAGPIVILVTAQALKRLEEPVCIALVEPRAGDVQRGRVDRQLHAASPDKRPQPYLAGPIRQGWSCNGRRQTAERMPSIQVCRAPDRRLPEATQALHLLPICASPRFARGLPNRGLSGFWLFMARTLSGRPVGTVARVNGPNSATDWPARASGASSRSTSGNA